MKKFVFVLACSGLLMTGCGEKAEQMKESIDAMQQLAEKGEEMEKSADEAKTMYEQRKSKGDTIAMPYKDLQAYLPTSISGYKPEGDPAGSQQSMPGYSFSNAEQNWIAEGNEAARIAVKIMDVGGTEAGYGMASLPLLMSFNMEDDHQRVESMKMDMPMTAGVATFNKDNKTSSVFVGTRYRYAITVESTGGQDDQTKMLTDLATEIAKKFDGK